jgi:hypothetical protein
MFFLLLIASHNYAQEILSHKKKTYTAPDGKLYIQKDLPVYLWISTDKSEQSEKYRLFSEETTRYSNPMYLDTEGYNTVRSPSAVDTTTRKTVYPVRDIIFEVYSDSRAPHTKIDYGKTELFTEGETLHLGSGTVITLTATDDGSGLENIYFSLNGAPFKPYTGPVNIDQEKEYTLKFYAVDNVGNVESLHEKKMIYDKSPPKTNRQVVGDQYENNLSGRSKISLDAEDGGTGTKHIYYSIDEGPEKIYTSPISAAYLSQDDHKLVYYSTDKVGNKEQSQTFEFYVDKTPPTIIEEVMGKSFFSGGREYSSGKSRLKLTSFDNKSGVKEVRYSVNAGDYELYDKPVFLTQSSGDLLIKSYAVDNVNNRSNSQTANEKTTIPYIDLTGPELTYAFSGPKFVTRDTIFINSSTKILLKAVDPESGLNRIEYSLNGSNPVAYTEPFTVENPGYNEVDYTGFDNVDNTSGFNFGFKVDNTGPIISWSFGTSHLRIQDGMEVFPAHAVLFVTANDGVVGFKRMTSSLNQGSAVEYSGVLKNLPKGKNSIAVTAYDNLGNTSEKEIVFIIE